MKTVLFLFFLISISAPLMSQEVIVEDTSSVHVNEAIVILPGFGDTKKGRKNQKSFFQHKGYDLYIPKYKDSKSLDNCVKNLEVFYEEQELKKYDRVHFFSYIVGSWTLNKFILKNGIRNISSIVYDRSPIQERAPYIVDKHLGFLVWLKGVKHIMKEMAETPYVPIEKDGIDIGIIIESKATPLMRIYKKKTLKMGKILWDVPPLNQSHDDYHYTWLNHDQMYTRFDIVGAEIFNFIKRGTFSTNAKREKYVWDPFVSYKKEGLK
jgi:hypothetical protein